MRTRQEDFIMHELFNSIFADSTQSTLSVGKFLLCIGISLLIGFAYSLAYSYRNRTGSSFRTAMVFLPVVVCVVIMMVNGNIGIGVAIAGAFSLVRFRSAQGSAKEISLIFMAMCSGLIAGVGYLAYAVLFSALMCLLILASNQISRRRAMTDRHRLLKITIPEDLNTTDLFADIFSEFTDTYELGGVKTTNMGSLFRLTYHIHLKKDANEKQMLDRLRTRNGNLEISLCREGEEHEL